MERQTKEAEFAPTGMPIPHTRRKTIVRAPAHNSLPSWDSLLDTLGPRSPGGATGQRATQATVAPTSLPPHPQLHSLWTVALRFTVGAAGDQAASRGLRQNERGAQYNAEGLAGAVREARASRVWPERRLSTCPFSRMAAGYMALLGRSRCVGSSSISRACRYLSGREGEPVTK